MVPSVLHAMDWLRGETVVTPGSAHTTETDFEGARLCLLAGNRQQSMHPSLDGGLESYYFAKIGSFAERTTTNLICGNYSGGRWSRPHVKGGEECLWWWGGMGE